MMLNLLGHRPYRMEQAYFLVGNITNQHPSPTLPYYLPELIMGRASVQISGSNWTDCVFVFPQKCNPDNTP